jgi:hypothetical protein
MIASFGQQYLDESYKLLGLPWRGRESKREVSDQLCIKCTQSTLHPSHHVLCQSGEISMTTPLQSCSTCTIFVRLLDAVHTSLLMAIGISNYGR